MTSQQDGVLTSEQRYDMLKKTLAHYLLLQVDTFVSGAGIEAIKPAMEILTDKKAELKVQEIKETKHVDRVKALSNHLVESMGETFDSDFDVESNPLSQKVTLSRCGCIESVLKESDRFSLTRPQVRSIFCGTCIGSYKKAAKSLNLDFAGHLTSEGCMMKFSRER